MAISEGDLVRCYHSPTNLWRVVEFLDSPSESGDCIGSEAAEKTDVERDVEVDDARLVWRMPTAEVLIENTKKEGQFMVCSTENMHPRSDEIGR